MNRDKIVEMLGLQDAINREINPNWRRAANPWYRAIWVECAEMIDHYGWKWWKKQEPNLAQVHLELVDIWHFGLSDLLQRHPEPTAADVVARNMRASLDGVRRGFLAAVEEFARSTIDKKEFDVCGFFELCGEVDLDMNTLYARYVGKNVLNTFRQRHGYKDGTYLKVWNGREDNEHLEDIISVLRIDANHFAEKVYEELQHRYKTLDK